MAAAPPIDEAELLQRWRARWSTALRLPKLRESARDTTLTVGALSLDVGRQRIDAAALDELRRWGERRGLLAAQRAMTTGQPVNASEGRSALHTALREPPEASLGAPPWACAEVQAERVRLHEFAEAVRSGAWRGASGRTITDVINLGIGGSDSGPRLVCDALAEHIDGPRPHFVANVDGHVLARLLPRLDSATTLLIVSSKSFATRETLLNARTALQWLEAAGVRGEGLARHVVTVSARADAAQMLGVPQAPSFRLWDWVGGRFSLWSAIGLPALLALGPQRFDELLGGAHDMDRHALEAPLAGNLPATLALLAWWNAVVIGTTSHCLLPYDERLRHMVTWLQQLAMESLGKSRRTDGRMVEVPTVQPVWGGVGTDAQHTFFQALRQGTLRSAVDIIAVRAADHPYAEHHRVLVANARAQAEALVAEDADSLALNAVSVIELDRLSPAALGALLSLYEHATTMQATLLGINAFDQPGVELGKRLAQSMERP
jgi:glucose-6-phosphate isomerase